MPDSPSVRYAGQNSVQLTDLVMADTDGDGVSNLSEFLAGTNPTNAASFCHLVALEPDADGLRVTWTAAGGKSYVVQTNGALSAPFGDASPLIAVPGSGESLTNLVDPAGTTNGPAKYYRVRLGP